MSPFNNNDTKKAFLCSNKGTARNYTNTAQSGQQEERMKYLTCDWRGQENTLIVIGTKECASPSPSKRSASGLVDNMSKEQNVLAATESEQICKMITGSGSPHCIPASEHRLPPLQKHFSLSRWIKRNKGHGLDYDYPESPPSALTQTSKVEILLCSKETKQSPRMLQKDGKSWNGA